MGRHIVVIYIDRLYHSAGTVPVFCKLRCTSQGSTPRGAAPKLKSIMALVLTGTLRLVL